VFSEGWPNFPMPPKAAAKAAAAKAPAAKAASKAPAPAKAAPDAKAKAQPKSPAGGGAAAAKALKAKEQNKAEEEAAAEQKKKEEAEKEEENKKAEAEAEAARKKAEEEAEAERKRKAEKANGDVVLKYSMYNEKFPIKDNKITAAEIDDVYCLSDVMPGCKIHLSAMSTEERYKVESGGDVFSYIFEEPVGTFHDLEAGETYYVYVEEDEEEFLKSQARAKHNFLGVKSEATRGEGCSCIEGNPCASECDANGNGVCLDWPNRFAVAKAHGWIGHQAK